MNLRMTRFALLVTLCSVMFGSDTAETVKEARLERSGKVSVVKRGEARVVEVRVEDGVQVVRVEVV